MLCYLYESQRVPVCAGKVKKCLLKQDLNVCLRREVQCKIYPHTWLHSKFLNSQQDTVQLKPSVSIKTKLDVTAQITY